MSRTVASAIRLGLTGLATSAVALGSSVTAASAQYVDARVLRRGEFRVSFEPVYNRYNRRFNQDGEQEPLGADLSADSAGVPFLPSLATPQAALQSVLDDPTYRMNIGAVNTDLEADIRHFPFNFQLGLANRVTFAASIPVVTTRSQVSLTVDSTNANVGWNQILPESGSGTGQSQAIALLGELTASIATLNGLVAAGAFDCPTGPLCDDARALITQAGTLRADLIGLTGVNETGQLAPELPPFAPLLTSAAGQALSAIIQDMATQFGAFGIAAILPTLPLPTSPVTADDINTVLTSPGFGYDAAPLEFIKLFQRLGDLDLGLRWGLLQTPSVRAVLTTSVRLPTGLRDLDSNFIDIGTGDKQTDLVAGLELAFEPGNVVSLALGAEYTLQLPDQLPRRITTPERPIALASTAFTVSRDLGDVVRLRAFPAVRLHPSLTAFTSVEYTHKQSDVYTLAASGGTTPPDVMQLELETGMERVSVGAGLHYRSLSGSSRTPVEAGLEYRTALQGSGGLTPMTTSMTLYLRLFYQLFGSR